MTYKLVDKPEPSNELSAMDLEVGKAYRDSDSDICLISYIDTKDEVVAFYPSVDTIYTIEDLEEQGSLFTPVEVEILVKKG